VTYRVEIAPEALDNIRLQAHYIAVVAQSPDNAARWLTRVLEAADSLEHYPRRCPLAPENDMVVYEVRAMSVDGFLLLFIIDDTDRTVTIVNARHGRQQPDS
jgi:plasmid stabilization system protein ParE